MWKETQLELARNYSLAVKPGRAKWEWKQWEGTQLIMAWNYSLSINPTKPEWEWGWWKEPSLIWNEVTYKLCSQHNQSGSTIRRDPFECGEIIIHLLSNQQEQGGVRTVRNPAGPGIKWLTCCQANRTRWVRGDPAWPGMKKHTCCQANRSRLRVSIRWRAPFAPEMKLLTSYQANREEWKWEHWEGTEWDLAWNHSPPAMPIGIEWRERQ